MHTIKQLAAMLATEWNDFNGKTVDDEKVDLPALKKIKTIQNRLVRSEFKSRADKAAGQSVLDDGDDHSPDMWCTFKIRLYRRMLKFT